MTAKELQTALTKAGYYKGAIDGDIGRQTRAAIGAFRRANRLGRGTNPGPATTRRLQRYLTARPPSPAAPSAAVVRKPAPQGALADRMRQLMGWLKADFGLDNVAAAAILGNWGHESALNPRARGAAGDTGLAQWTGSRRRALRSYAAAHGADMWALRTQYEFARQELKGAYARAISAVRRPGTLQSKTQRLEIIYEGAGVKHYHSRYAWAARALRSV